MTDRPLRGKRILYLVTEDWYFWSHRLPMARAARDAGARVIVATRVTNHGDRIRNEGFDLVPIPFDRSGLNPVRDLKTLYRIWRAYRRRKPHLVHHVALKPALYGGLAAWAARVPAVVNAMAGMGFMFISEGRKARLMRPVIQWVFHHLNNRKDSRVILQNDDDAALFSDEMGVKRSRIRVVRGSGVDIKRFAVRPEPAGQPVAVCVSRMLWDKGIGELIAAARILKERGVQLTVRLVGPLDDNPASVSAADLKNWADEGLVEVAGPTDTVAEVYAAAHIAVLPSYREGLPKSLLEAAACGRAMVATDVPGCREICRHEQTGLLVPVKTAEPLADALQALAEGSELRRRYGGNARTLAEERFADNVIAGQTLDVYLELLKGQPTGAGHVDGSG